MTKPYHPGHAAESGINSARLAAAGFTANPEAVLGNQGFVRAASTPDDATERLAAMATAARNAILDYADVNAVARRWETALAG